MPRTLPFIHAAEELGDALTERLAPILASADLTPAQFNVLYMLVEDGPMTLGELAKFQRCVKSNISYITRTMDRDGLIQLAASESDQRARSALSCSRVVTRSARSVASRARRSSAVEARRTADGWYVAIHHGAHGVLVGRPRSRCTRKPRPEKV